MVIYNVLSADFVLMSADVVLKMTTILICVIFLGLDPISMWMCAIGSLFS